ncbi:hypothetical protein [Nocardioides panacisoli]|uniref:Uncharacterized protein n=1 Tax=Nocardioides panacisoli TaxID=627624 RepID=A0ABP7I4V1_9ACTN
MTWKAFHSRGETLRSVIHTASVRRDGILPMDVDGVSETFRDELDLLSALQLKWHTRLSGHVDRLMITQPMDLQNKVTLAWKNAAEELPGVRMILDHYRDEPTSEAMAQAMRVATAKEHQYLAVMAGRSGLADESSERIGAEIEQAGRDLFHGVTAVIGPVAEIEEPQRQSLLDRLRAVIAA